MTSKIKRMLGKTKWGKRSKDRQSKNKEGWGKTLEELRRCQSELKRTRSALRACWKLCRTGECGEAVTKIVIEALQGEDAKTRGR